MAVRLRPLITRPGNNLDVRLDYSCNADPYGWQQVCQGLQRFIRIKLVYQPERQTVNHEYRTRTTRTHQGKYLLQHASASAASRTVNAILLTVYGSLNITA